MSTKCLRRAKRRCLRPKTCILSTICFLASAFILYKVATLCTDVEILARQETQYKATLNRNIDVEKVVHELSGFRHVFLKDVEETVIPNTVHYVWCHKRTIAFRQYLVILSVWKILQPDAIEFHHKFPIPSDDKYSTWYTELKQRIPGFVSVGLPVHWDGEELGCGPWFGIAVVDDRGGVYVNEDTYVTDASVPLLKQPFSVALDTDSKGKPEVGLLMANSHNEEFRAFKRRLKRDALETSDKRSFCQKLGNVDGKVNETNPCFSLKKDIFPRDIATIESQFGDYSRTLFYGSPNPKLPAPFLPGVIPKIVHYVWFGSKELDFFMYLSILSTLFIVDPEKVLIHWDGGLHGHYFDLILKDKRVTTVYREKPMFIYGNQVLYGQHRSDIVRAEALLKFGGIYMDWDVLWVKSPDELIATGYDAMVNFDHMPSAVFPETINLGVFMSKPKATFVKRWQDALINYRSSDFLYNAVELPYKIYEKYPDTIHIDRHLQVMCFHLMCHPTFTEDFKDFSKAQDFDWRTEAFSLHFTYPDPPAYVSEEVLRNTTGMFAEIGLFILQHAKKLS